MPALAAADTMIYTYVAVALVSAAIAGTTAWRVQSWRFDSAKLEAIEDAHEREKMRRQAANSGAQAHESDKTKIRTVFQTITEKVEHEIQTERVVYSNVCIAPGGLQQLADAARATGFTSEPVNPMPAASAAK